jgi:phosphoglycerate dehydrogenase-like enzyme
LSTQAILSILPIKGYAWKPISIDDHILMTPYRILVTARSFANTPGTHHAYLHDNGCEVDLRAPAHPYTTDQLREMVVGFDGIIAGLDTYDASVMERADRLRVISRYGVSVDAVDLEAAGRKGVAVTSTPGANLLAVSELTVGLMFALARQIPQVAAARAGDWIRPMGWELSGKTLGVIGFGAIGRDVARKSVALGLRVLAYDPFSKEDVPGVNHADLETSIRQADILSLHSALTPATANLINAERIAWMKDGAYLINTARGDLVDEDALLAALKSGKIGGAACDVFRIEPPVGSPLLALENFIAIPHLGATTRESVERMAIMAARNLVAVLKSEPCDYIVNAQRLKTTR